MVLLIPAPLTVQINQAAASAYPLECCGLMLGRILSASSEAGEVDDRQVCELAAVDNRWDVSVQGVTDPGDTSPPGQENALDRHRRYWIDPEMMLKVQKQARDRNLDIIGVYHSHPEHPAIPSECDRRLAWPVYSYVIVSVKAGETETFLSWRLNDDRQFRSEPVKILDKI